MTGQGGWPMTVRARRPTATPFFAGTYFPDQPRQGQPAFRQVLAGARDAWTSRRDEVTHGRRRRRRSPASARSALAGEEPPRRRPARGCGRPRWPTTSTPTDGGFGACARSSRRRWCWSSCCATPRGPVAERLRDGRPAPARRWLAAASTTSSPAASRATRSTRSWVVPHFEKMLYDNAQLLGVYVRAGGGRRATRSASASPGRRPTSCSRELRHRPRAASPPRSTPTPRASRAGSTSGRRPQLSEVLGADDGAWAADAARGHRGRHLRARRRRRCSCYAEPDDPDRWADVRARLLDARASAPAARRATTRWSRPGTVWRSRRSPRPGRCSGEPSYVDAAVGAVRAARRPAPRRHGRLRRVSRDGGRRPARRCPRGLRRASPRACSRCSR